MPACTTRASGMDGGAQWGAGTPTDAHVAGHSSAAVARVGDGGVQAKPLSWSASMRRGMLMRHSSAIPTSTLGMNGRTLGQSQRGLVSAGSAGKFPGQ